MNAFLTKVYDKYEKSDYAGFSQDNLNPLREISPYETVELEKLESQAYAIISGRIRALKQQMSDMSITFDVEPTPDDPNVVAPSGLGEGLLKGMSTQDLINLNNSGSVGNLMFPVPHLQTNPFLDMNPLLSEIDQMIIPLIQGYSGIGKTGIGGSGSGGGASTDGGSDGADTGSGFDIAFLDEAPFGFVCPEDDSSNGAKSTPDSSSSSNNNNSGSNNNASNGADEGTDITDSNTTGTGNGGKKSGDDDDAAAADAKDQKDCVLAELEFLKAILTILKVLQIFRSIVSYIMGIIMPIIEIIQYACGCWLNPSNFAMILQRMIQAGIAVLIGFISELIQWLWDMLNQDCLVQQALSAWAAANEAVLGTAKVVSDTKSAVSFTSNSVKKIMKATADTEKAFKQAAEQAKAVASMIDNPNSPLAKAAFNEWNTAFGQDSKLAKQVVGLFKNGGALNPATLIANNMPPELVGLAANTSSALNNLSKELTKGFDWNPLAASNAEKSLSNLKNKAEY